MNGVQEKEYVTIQMHDVQLERIEMLIERNFARQEAIAGDIKGEIRELHGEIKALDTKIDGVEKKLDAKIDTLDSKVDAVGKRLETKIDGVEKRLETKIDGVMDAITITNSRIDDLHNKKSNNIALWAIAAAVGICAFQAIVSLISLLK